MINPDQIVTAELLAGLTKCPFCGVVRLHCTKTELTLECGTYMRLGMRADRMRGGGCMEQEIETLRARVLELAQSHLRYETVRKMNASEFAKLLQRCVFQDLKFDDEVDKLSEKGTK